MKSLISIISTCLISSMLFSCEQNAFLDEGASGNVQTKSTQTIDTPYLVEADRALNFRSAEDYFAITDSLSKLTESEFRDWEIANNFKSYRTYTNNIISKFYEAIENDDNQEATNILTKNKDYIYITEDSIARPMIKSLNYQNITNQNGIFYLNGVKNIVDREFISLETSYKSKNIKKIAYVTPIGIQTRDEQKQYKLLSYTKEDGTKRAYAECYLIKNIAFQDTEGANQTMIQFQIIVDGKRKKPAGWKNYTTSYAVEDITCVFNEIPKTLYPNGTVATYGVVEFIHSAQERLGSGKSGIYLANLMEFSVKNLTKPLYEPTCIHFKAVTGGTNPEGVGYNYHAGNYSDMDHNITGDKLNTKICPNHKNVLNR